MLKIWKQSWKHADSASSGHNEGTTLSREHGTLQSSTTMHQSHHSVHNEGEHHILGSLDPMSVDEIPKKTRSIADLKDALVGTPERPVKRRKIENVKEGTTKEPPTALPLPEFPDVQELRPGDGDEHAEDVDLIVSIAKKQNTIAIVDDNTLRAKCICSMLAWSHDKERALPYIGITRRKKVAVVVCSNDQAPNECATELSEFCGLSIGVFDSSSIPTLSYWSELVTRDVIIIGASSLSESLACGSLAIPQIHILIFCDANATGNPHLRPIHQIMGEFYVITDTLSRPKVFGFLGGSPLLGNKLEKLLDAKVYVHRSMVVEEDNQPPQRLSELVIFYEPHLNRTETSLMRTLHLLDPSETVFRSHFYNAKLTLASLGHCASDLIWRRAFKEIDSTLPSMYDDDNGDDDNDNGDSHADRLLKTKINIRNSIKNWVFAMPNLDKSSRGFNVSSKLLKLIQILNACKPEGDIFRGIVFVQKRCLAFVLVDIIRMLEDRLGFIRPIALSRHGASLESLSEADVLEGFKSGLYNLLIVTKHGEDLDLSPATIVVRFDLFESQVSYAYCRARMRQRNGFLVHMAERGNDIHRGTLERAAKSSKMLERWIEKISKSQNGAVPPEALLETVNPYRSDSEDEKSESGPFIQDPTTSGRIYVQDALTVVYRYVSQMQDSSLPPLFEIDTINVAGSGKQNYVCTVLLPPESPVRRVSGSPCETPSQARRVGCYQACVELFNRGVLDYRLFPRQIVSPKGRWQDPCADFFGGRIDAPPPDLRQQRKTSATGVYPRKQPDFWGNASGASSGRLYPTVICPSTSADDGESGIYAPIVVLTKMPLPPFPSFNVFFSGIPRKISMVNAPAIEVDDDKLHALRRYTTRIARVLTNKPLVCPLENMCYFFAPLPASWSDTSSEDSEPPDISKEILWNNVFDAGEKAMRPLNLQDNQTLAADLEDCVIQDRWVEFTRRFYPVKLRTDLTPLSKPEDSPREKDYENMLEYCKARRKGFTELQNVNQPLIQVDQVPSVVNSLNPSSRPPAETKRSPAKYLIPELCARSTIPASAFRTALLLPSILRRVDDLLLVKELNAKFFDHSIAENHLHEAISSPSSLVEVDYERLELLGDAYLKYLASIYVFVTNPTQTEGTLHTLRQQIVSNKALWTSANTCGLPQYIQSKPFLSKVWAPPNFYITEATMSGPKRVRPDNDLGQVVVADNSGVCSIKEHSDTINIAGNVKNVLNQITGGTMGKSDSTVTQKTMTETSMKIATSESGVVGNDKDGDIALKAIDGATKPAKHIPKKRTLQEANTQFLGDKCVADVAEAVIGAAFITGGREVALKVTKALKIPVPHMNRWSDFGRKALAPSAEVTAKLRDGSVEAVEAIIGHKIKRPHLLAQALTHASIRGKEMTCYERLEFIGDAILDFLVIRHIFYRDGKLSPGSLTLLKGAMVSNVTLAAVCVSAGLHEYLHYESAALAASIRAYAVDLTGKQEAEIRKAAEEHRPPGQYWIEIEPPKALSDVIESIIGAVFLSDDFSPTGAETFFDKILKPFYDRFIRLQTISQHPTKILLELLQSRGCQNFELHREHASSGSKTLFNCDVVVHDVILASAVDHSSTAATRRACYYALDALEGDPRFMNRTCDCRMNGQKKAKAPLISADEDEEMFVEGLC